MSAYQERYSPVICAAATPVIIGGSAIGGFLATAVGTVTFVTQQGVTLLNAQPVVAGWNPMPIYIGPNGGTFTASVAGLLGV